MGTLTADRGRYTHSTLYTTPDNVGLPGDHRPGTLHSPLSLWRSVLTATPRAVSAKLLRTGDCGDSDSDRGDSGDRRTVIVVTVKW